MRRFHLLLLLALLPAPAAAHGLRAAYLEVREQAPGTALATLRENFADTALRPRFPDGCAAEERETGAEARGTQTRSYLVRCPGPLAGGTIGLDGLGAVLSEGVVRVALADGSGGSHVLTPAAPSWRVPRRQGAWQVATGYTGLGVRHILGGADHLLFLLGLLLLVRRPRAVLLTETAFTFSHSLSFSATALGWVHVYAPAAEACIALSLVLLALDVGRPARPWQGAALALVFGLVHGLGFAGGLSEIGLPDGAVATALLGFALGVELGQVAFLAVLLGALLLVQRWRAAWVPRLCDAGAYLIGTTGAWWLIGRLCVCLL